MYMHILFCLDFDNRAAAPPTPKKLLNKPNLNTGPGGGVKLIKDLLKQGQKVVHKNVS